MGFYYRILTTMCLASMILTAVWGQRLIGHRRSRHPCPSKCYCLITGTTVRCMHRSLVKIPRIPPNTLILDLRFNRISQVSSDDFRGLSKLHTLLMNNNQVRHLPHTAFANLPSLRHLYLYKNRIEDVANDAFSGLSSLEQLYLHNNDISSLDATVFTNLPNLERLFLHNNHIEALPEGLLEDLHSLKRLRLDNNQLRCDCKMLWFAKLLHSNGGNMQATATCRSPRSLFGRSISTIPLDSFRCNPPIFTTQPDGARIRTGESIYLSCIASGSPQPKITWHHNGERISGGRSRQTEEGSLILMNPTEIDQGFYKCVATNAVGRVESREVRVVHLDSAAGPPVLLTIPESTEVKMGETFSLDCKAAGTPEPTIHWSKHGVEIESSDNLIITETGTLHIGSISLLDLGNYTCTARNDEGEVAATATIFIKTPPTFTQRPTDLMVLRGESATFTCRFAGDPAPSVTWLKNGEALPRDQRYLIMSSGDLLIRAVNSGDDGQYTCEVRNSEGVASSLATLTVHVPPNFIVRPQSQRVRQGHTVDFQCQASGIPQPHIVWTLNGRAIPNNNRYQVLPSGTLRLLRVQTADAGLFTCEAANPLGARSAQVTLEVIPFRAIQFVRVPSDLTAGSGTEVTIPCHVQQDPNSLNTITISWLKDGVGIVSSDERYHITPSPNSFLTIRDVGLDDAGRYECVARSGSLTSAASMVLTVNVQSTTDEIVDKLFKLLPDGCFQEGCSGEPDNLNEISDEEVAKVLRELGIETNGRSKRQSVESGLEELRNRITVISNNVDGAVNNTIRLLNDRKHKQTASELITLLRFPSTNYGLGMTRAAEIFEATLQLVECCIKRGMKLRKFAIERHRSSDPRFDGYDFDIEDDVYNSSLPVIGTEVVAVIANLSGCSSHTKIPDCSSNICFHRKYRTADGSCNNLQHPTWGASLTPFHRLLTPVYENGFNEPRGWDHDKLYNGRSLPSARRVSLEVLAAREARPAMDEDYTHMTMQWGQFLDHDFDLTTLAPSIQRFSDEIACKDSCENVAPCFPVSVSDDDPRYRQFHREFTNEQGRSDACMTFTRSSAVCGSGITSIFSSSLSRREQINQVTSYLDGSNVYGNTAEEMKNLRDLTSDLGLLKEGQPLEPGQKALLPYNIYSDTNAELSVIKPVAPIECRRGEGESPQEQSVPCFLCGDLRCNEQVSLTSMHTLWMREHNRIARKLKEFNPNWNGDTIFQEARKIVGAEMQHITYSHWLPKIFGPDDGIGDYRTYDPNSPGSIVNAFATAAYRFGHTTINPFMFRLNETWGETSHGHLMLHQAFFAPYRLIHEGGIDPLIRGLIARPMKARASDSGMSRELIERLFEKAEEVALDLGSLNIQRGRDHGLPFYNDWREYCNLTRATTFEDLAGEITNQEVLRRLENVYGTVKNVEAFAGMILEDVKPGSKLGPTLTCIIREQFRRIRDNDRFYYENPGMFSPDQLTEIRQTSLAMIICENSDGISTVSRDVFRNTALSDFVPCAEIPKVDLRAWKECRDSCVDENQEQNDVNTLSSHVRRQKRSISESHPKVFRKPGYRRKVERKARKNLQNEVTHNDRHKVFAELAWSQSLGAKNNPMGILGISKTIMNEDNDGMDKIVKDLAIDELANENMGSDLGMDEPTSKERLDETGDSMVKLLNIIQAMESKIASLQGEIKRLSGKIDK